MQVSTALVTVLGVVIDGIVTGSCLGVDAMASYGLCTPVTFLYAGLAGIFAMGISIPCGRVIGTGDKDATNRIFSQSVFFALACGIIIMLVTFFGAEAFARLLGASEDLLPESANFLRGFAFTAPAMFVVNGLLPIMQIDGDRGRALVAVITLTAVNVAIDLLNGFVLHGGLFFMAIATSTSFYAALIVLLLHFRKGRGMFRIKRPHFEAPVIRDLVVYGLPNALQQVCRGALVACMNNIIISVTADHRAVAAYAAINVASMLCMAVGTGVGQSVSIITSILAGEKDEESLRNLMKVALRTTIVVNCLLAVAIIGGAPVLMLPFVASDPTCLDLAVDGFRLFGLCIVFYGVNVVFRAYYQAMRMVRLAIPYVLLDNFASTAGFAFALGLAFGITGVWLSFFAGEAFTLLVFIIVAIIGRTGSGLLGKMMHIGRDFAAEIEAGKAWSCTSEAQVEETSEAVHDFCRENGASERTALLLALATEEMGVNTVRYGFADGKRHSIDVKALQMRGGWMLRIRDDCALFDPLSYLDSHEDDDPTVHIGIRMVRKVADRMEYVSTLKLNNLLVEISENGSKSPEDTDPVSA